MSEYERVRALLRPDALLDELRAALTRYVVLPSPEAADAVVLWIAATHAQPAWEHATRLGIVAPEKRCGKTRLLNVIEMTCYYPIAAVNATTAAVYRSISEQEPPTLLFDEVDALFGNKRKAEDNEDLRALLNAGHERGRPVLRCVGPQQEVKPFPSFAMAALAGIGDLPDTIADRAVMVRMRRRAPGETVRPYRRRRDGEPLAELRERLRAWVREHLAELEDVEPPLPVEDRAADTWESLVAIADLAGGDWPGRARRAAVAFVRAAGEADAEVSESTRLLADIQDVFRDYTVSFLSSQELLTALCKIDDAPWREIELSVRGLATRLGRYGIKPGHNTAKTARGYRLESFLDAFSRYLPSESVQPSETAPDLQVLPDASRTPDASIRPEVSIRPDVSAGQTRFTDAWTGPDAPSTETHEVGCPAEGWGPIGSEACTCGGAA